MNRSDEIICHDSPHTIKKFELTKKYVEAWAHNAATVIKFCDEHSIAYHTKDETITD